MTQKLNYATPHRGKNFDRLLCAYSSPRAAYDILNEADAMYAHAVFALKDRSLGMLEANFASNICDFLDFIQDHGPSLACDIEEGRIWSHQRPEDPIAGSQAEAALNAALQAQGNGECKKGESEESKQDTPILNSEQAKSGIRPGTLQSQNMKIT